MTMRPIYRDSRDHLQDLVRSEDDDDPYVDVGPYGPRRLPCDAAETVWLTAHVTGRNVMVQFHPPHDDDETIGPISFADAERIARERWPDADIKWTNLRDR